MLYTQEEAGAFANISSAKRKVAVPYMLLYSVSNFALKAFAEDLALRIENATPTHNLFPGCLYAGSRTPGLGKDGSIK